jgi:hypothetical protein
MSWQVPNEPSGKFTENGAPSLCQCISDDNRLHTNCLPSAVRCRSQCGQMYPYLPDARQSCAVSRKVASRGRA